MFDFVQISMSARSSLKISTVYLRRRMPGVTTPLAPTPADVKPVTKVTAGRAEQDAKVRNNSNSNSIPFILGYATHERIGCIKKLYYCSLE